jgi:DnaJ domain
MVWVLLVVTLLVGGAFMLQWFLNAEPREILRALRWSGLIVAVVLAIVLLVTRQFQLIYTVAIFLVPWLLRVRALRNRMKSARGPAAGQASEVHTRFVVMQLDHDSGDMDGTVREGPFAGKRLSALALKDVVSIYRLALAADQTSAQVLQAYLERMHGDAWRAGSQSEGGAEEETAGAGKAGGGPMSRAEARAVLGVGPDATADEIKQAHRRLMKQYHPDHGGSDYLAAKINEAKEVLLGER